MTKKDAFAEAVQEIIDRASADITEQEECIAWGNGAVWPAGDVTFTAPAGGVIQAEDHVFLPGDAPYLSWFNGLAPVLTHCPCGAELMGDKARARQQCGDCAAAGVAPPPTYDLDQRIATAKAESPLHREAARDKDPTSAWAAGSTPSWEW